MRVFQLSVILLGFVVALPVSAAVYTWEDDKGVVGFTEEYGNIPKKYRKKAKLLGTEDAESPAVEEPKAAKVKNESSGRPKDVVQPDVEGASKIYGGKDENYWRMEFAKANYDLKNIRSQIDAIKSRLAHNENMSRSEYLMLENSRKMMEEQELAIRRQLDSLSAAANKAGVPADLR